MNEMNAMNDKEASSVEDTEARSAMKLALELFEQFGRDSRLKYEHQAIYKTIVALKEALAGKQEQRSVRASADSEHMGEPVAWTLDSLEQEIYANTRTFVSLNVMEWLLTRLNTTPQQPSTIVRTWVGLTTKDQKEIQRQSVYVEGAIRMTEAKLKEKNT
jgi:hypothetical protein